MLCQHFFPGLHTLRFRLLTLLDFWETDPPNDWNDKKLSGGSIYEKLVANSSSANTTAQNSFKHWAWALVVDELSKKMAGMYIVK